MFVVMCKVIKIANCFFFGGGVIDSRHFKQNHFKMSYPCVCVCGNKITHFGRDQIDTEMSILFNIMCERINIFLWLKNKNEI